MSETLVGRLQEPDSGYGHDKAPRPEFVEFRRGAFKYVRLRPTLPHRHQCSTIGAEGLSFRVRNGAGRFPFAMTAETLLRYSHSRPYLGNRTVDAKQAITHPN